jgi:hypothetical protein
VATTKLIFRSRRIIEDRKGAVDFYDRENLLQLPF